jgi:hypothetical protein
MSKHTQKPWLVETGGKEWAIWGGDMHSPKPRYRVLSIKEGIIPTNADRDLIAAAPELLEALQATLDALYNETHGQDDSPWIASVKTAARAAIAKAKGGAE